MGTQIILTSTHQMLHCLGMRTTLDIDDDVLSAAKDLAKAEGRTMGQVISDLARWALTQPSLATGMATGMQEAQVAYMADDFPAFPFRGDSPPVTNDMVRRLQDVADAEDAEVWDHQRDQPRDLPKTGRG
jgi:hypothetical protein